ncbi:MAG: maleylacetate reductase [Pseudolabrys sp.]|nr:maleylacetate reductase [Pseudolabrys sp.]
MMLKFVQDTPSQRVVFGSGSLARLAEEVARLGLSRVLVVATPGHGARLAALAADLLGSSCAGVHAQAVVHVPRAVAEAGIAEAARTGADGVVAMGGGAAIGLAKAIAIASNLPIVAVPTTYSGSEASPIAGTTDGERKITVRDPKALPKTIIYDPDLTLGLPPAVSAASGLNAIAHAVEGLWIAERTPISCAMATEAMRLFADALPKVVADGNDRDARAACLSASWLCGIVLTSGTALHHKLAHVLGGLGMPHAETHSIILPHVTRFNLDAAPDAHERLCDTLETNDPAHALGVMLSLFPIPQALREVGLPRDKIDFVAAEAAKLNITAPRSASEVEIRGILEAAY